MAPPKKASPKRAKKKAFKSEELPVTLQALRERAGFTRDDGAGPEFREFFAGFKFGGDPDRETAIAIVAVDSVLRDPSFLDGTTCFGEGQIDTAANAARLILGPEKMQRLGTIGGEDDLEELASHCRALSGDEDVKNGVMAARHLWGMFNTVTRAFPSSFFRNGSSTDFQAAMLGAAARHLAVFSPDKMDARADLTRMIAMAEKISELGAGGKYYQSPKDEEEAASTFLFLCKNGRFSELHSSPLLEQLGDAGSPSASVLAECGMRAKRERERDAKGEEETSWRDDPVLSGNGAFFAGRSFEEIKARYPGYPGHSSEVSYWDACARHPATHGICCRLYGKMGQLIRSGGVEEGISRAVTNKMAHHNTKFSRLSLWVHLSDGKGFYVHRTRPVNWAAHGVTEPPFSPDNSVGDQLELQFQPKRGGAKGAKGAKRAKEPVSVVGYEMRSVNYSHMPWVNKAILQYAEEAAFIKSPADEHQEVVSSVARALRGAGATYKEAFDSASDIYSQLVGRGAGGAEKTAELLRKAASKTETAEELEAEVAGLLRECAGRGGGRISEVIGGCLAAQDVRRVAGERGEQVLEDVTLSLAKASDILSSYGLPPEIAREAIFKVAGAYPVKAPEGGEGVVSVLKEAGVAVAISPADASEIGKVAGGIASRVVDGICSVSQTDIENLGEGLREVMKTGVLLDENGQKIPGRVGTGDKGETSSYLKLVGKIAKSMGVGEAEAGEAAVAGLRFASDTLPEIERAFARAGTSASDELLDHVLGYAVKHCGGAPVDREEVHRRKMVLGGVDTISLDAPVGEDGKRDLHSVIGDGREAHYVDYEPEDLAVGAGEQAHWLDEASGSENSPSFVESGGSEIFAPFSMSRIADSLYKVVSTKGTEQQLQMLRDFAGLQVDSIAAGGSPDEARRQIGAMLDIVDREDAMEGENGVIRRRFLTWVFSSVLNAAGVDGDGYDRLGGINAASLRKGLFDKIRRYGMPGVVVVENSDISDSDRLGSELRESKAWGYGRAGICLPRGAGSALTGWSESGGVRNLLSVLEAVPGAAEKTAGVLEGRTDAGGTAERSLRILLGKSTKGAGEALSFLEADPKGEERILAAVRAADPGLHRKLVLAKMAAKNGLAVDCLGNEEDAATVADGAKMDSLIFLSGSGKAVAEAVSGFGIKSRVVPGTPGKALAEHVDYHSVTVGKDGKLDKNLLIAGSNIPLARKLLMAAETAQESLDKSGGRGGR